MKRYRMDFAWGYNVDADAENMVGSIPDTEGGWVRHSDALAAVETARKDAEAEAYWRSVIAGELDTSGYDGWHIAAAFVRGKKREGQNG